ncbi:MAG TPA: DUF3891 family protein [Candidatus Sulfomarinibacteraceae bacterium]|nr:DUF3891 family protein [Candidatus Sulfomarinibacteraceae bacterium]
MITNQTDDEWEIIFQRAHALLAAKLVTYWRPEDRPLRWTETLNAVAQHDNGWQEWEAGERLTDAGAPRNFMQLPLPEVVIQGERVVTRAWHQSMWVGLLVSRHISHLHERRRGALASLDDLLDEQIELREKWRAALDVSREDVDRAYSLLRWGDSFSLILCMQRLPVDERAVEIERGPDGQRYDVFQRTDGVVVVQPWPYDRDSFRVSVDCHYLTQATFADDDELAQALRQAQVRQRVWELRRA